ncbi:methyltransferase domain-containing protein [Saccharothrix sp.]|uniref:class I SAM-dependent methyltransferase n=1 Tax=Saccharothrix sp. TaxID=1873460 RepID=UPI002811684D|nr:methyltransferase domain-containing protein [Saccharothrix sp.]
MNTTEQTWRTYLAAYHDDRPAITERLLGLAGSSLRIAGGTARRDRSDTGPRLRLSSHPAVAARCPVDRTGLLRQRTPYAAADDRTPLVRGNANALPTATGPITAVCAALSLQVLTPPDTVLSEVRRVLKPDGALVALVPARPGLRSSGLLR